MLSEDGKTLGTPVCMFVPNEDQRPNDYSSMSDTPRPSHADYTYIMKYGIKASSGRNSNNNKKKTTKKKKKKKKKKRRSGGGGEEEKEKKKNKAKKKERKTGTH